MSDLRKRQYLIGSLKLDPSLQASEIVHRRAIALGLEKAAPKPASPPTRPSETAASPTLQTDTSEANKQRTKIRKRLAAIRSEFWTKPAVHLNRQLDALPASEFPELQATKNRLKLLLSHQAQLNEIGAMESRDLNFWNTLKRILIQPSQQAGNLKEQYVRRLAQAENPDRVKRMIKSIRKKYPEVYSLESDWFDLLLRTKAAKRETGGVSIELDSDSWGWIWWVVVIILFGLLRVAFRIWS